MTSVARMAILNRRLGALALGAGLGLAEEHGDVLMVLLAHLGHPLTSQQMCRLVNTHRPIRLNVFQERIRAIREVMGRDAIAGFRTAAEREVKQDNGSFGFGPTDYALSDAGVELCRAALEKVGASLPLIVSTAPSVMAA